MQTEPELEKCKQQVTALLAKGHIQPSCSPYKSPVLFMPGGLLMRIDFRGLNEQTFKKDVHHDAYVLMSC